MLRIVSTTNVFLVMEPSTFLMVTLTLVPFSTDLCMVKAFITGRVGSPMRVNCSTTPSLDRVDCDGPTEATTLGQCFKEHAMALENITVPLIDRLIKALGFKVLRMGRGYLLLQMGRSTRVILKVDLEKETEK